MARLHEREATIMESVTRMAQIFGVALIIFFGSFAQSANLEIYSVRDLWDEFVTDLAG